MRPEAIFLPVCALALWTMAILIVTAYQRIQGTRAGRIPIGAFKLGESADVPRDVALWNRNFMNLLEMPVLFYVGCLSAYVTRQVAPGMVWLAWVYVVLRVVHSCIHVTTNRILRRLASFALSNFVLLALWLWFALRLI